MLLKIFYYELLYIPFNISFDIQSNQASCSYAGLPKEKAEAHREICYLEPKIKIKISKFCYKKDLFATYYFMRKSPYTGIIYIFASTVITNAMIL